LTGQMSVRRRCVSVVCLAGHGLLPPYVAACQLS
jgi:hypothetical protein